MDYAMLADKRVGAGAGASAMDSAATALEAGAASVDLLIRRDDIRASTGQGRRQPRPDPWPPEPARRLEVEDPPLHQRRPGAAAGSTRVSRHPNARFNLGCGVQDLALIDDEIRVTTPKGEFALDPDLLDGLSHRLDRAAGVRRAARMRAWGDRYTPPPAEDQELHDSPTWAPPRAAGKSPGACPGLDRTAFVPGPR